ncbi:MAG: hypothetical protein ACR2O4_14255 [Hyphomicrobiaceae bacterium]
MAFQQSSGNTTALAASGQPERSDTLRMIMVQTPMGAAMCVPVRAAQQPALQTTPEVPLTYKPAPASAPNVCVLHPAGDPSRPAQQGSMILLDDRVAAAAQTR